MTDTFCHNCNAPIDWYKGEDVKWVNAWVGKRLRLVALCLKCPSVPEHQRPKTLSEITQELKAKEPTQLSFDI